MKRISRKFRGAGSLPSFTSLTFLWTFLMRAGPAAVAGQQAQQRTRQQFFRTRPQDSFVSEGGRAIISCVIGNLGGRVQWTKDGLTMGNISIPAISPLLPPPSNYHICHAVSRPVGRVDGLGLAGWAGHMGGFWAWWCWTLNLKKLYGVGRSYIIGTWYGTGKFSYKQ